MGFAKRRRRRERGNGSLETFLSIFVGFFLKEFRFSIRSLKVVRAVIGEV